jgi:hypothetical protein
MYSRFKSASEKEGAVLSNAQKIMLAEINKKLPDYGRVKRMIARQVKDDK